MRKKTILINLACIFFSLVIVFAILEISFRISNYRKASIIRNFKYISPKEGTQSRAFREKLPKIEAPKKGYMILALGDSYTWGDKISDPKDVWTNVLEDKLNKKYKDKNIQVINFARCGWTTVNEMEIFLLYGVKLNPDMVIVQYSLNDPLPSGKKMTRVGGDWLKKEIATEFSFVKSDNLYRKLSAKSEFLQWFNNRINSLRLIRQGKHFYHKLYDDDFSGWKNTKKALIAINAASKNIGADTILMLAPYLVKGRWTERSYPYTDIYQKVKDSAEASDMYVVDTMPYFYDSNMNLSEYHAIKDIDQHPGVQAQKIMADSVYDLIVENELMTEKTY